jgi:hypothetical protein
MHNLQPRKMLHVANLHGIIRFDVLAYSFWYLQIPALARLYGERT